MRQTFLVICLTVLSLIGMDLAVSAGLSWAEARGRLGSLVQYFDYGRSVPGKIARWEADPDRPDNIYSVAWRPEAIAISAADFNAETAMTAPVVRSYGMSFVNRILQVAQQQDSTLQLDLHAAPAGSPNFTYAMFLDDRANRRAGDIAVLGLLSSSVPAMAALTNATWSFEQPAPFTYPIFRPGEDHLTRIDPVISSLADQRRLDDTPQISAAWTEQLATQDAFYSQITFGVPVLDASPLMRLMRRALAKSHIADVEKQIIAGDFPYQTVLAQMITEFAATARADGQRPVVMLIQSSRPGDPNLLQITGPLLEDAAIPYLATTRYADPTDITLFEPDGHYTAQIDQRFAQAVLELLDN